MNGFGVCSSVIAENATSCEAPEESTSLRSANSLSAPTRKDRRFVNTDPSENETSNGNITRCGPA